jgi:hypothetical protein
MLTPRTRLTQTLTKGPRSFPSISTGQRNGGTAVQKQNVPHIPYVRRPVGSGIVATISLTPATSATRHPVGSVIVVMIASTPVISIAQ